MCVRDRREESPGNPYREIGSPGAVQGHLGMPSLLSGKAAGQLWQLPTQLAALGARSRLSGDRGGGGSERLSGDRRGGGVDWVGQRPKKTLCT